jgi:multiple sugar transport system permease protein
VVVYYVYRSIRDSAYGLGAAASYVVAGGLLLLLLAAALGARWRRAARA